MLIELYMILQENHQQQLNGSSKNINIEYKYILKGSDIVLDFEETKKNLNESKEKLKSLGDSL